MKTILGLVVVVALLTGCSGRDKRGKALDTPTSGSISIAVDESLKPLVEAEIHAFEGIYHNAHINVTYTSEGEAIDALLKDSVRMAIVTRKLVEGEEKKLLDQVITPTQLGLAKDAVALIINPQNRDSLVQLADLKKILGGEMEAVNAARKKGSTFSEVVFDQPNSGIIRYLRESLMPFDSLPKYCFALKSNAAVVEYVSQKPQALGLIDVSWISDRDDSTTNSFLHSIRVMGISQDSGHFQPYQAYIAQGKYPLVRNVVMISREARSGLATGFITFCASDKGQRIVLKSGLVPSTMPLRIVEINHEPF
jgi:phosphate transport system substrate-binding protein